MTTIYMNYYIQKKMISQQFRDILQLGDNVRQIENLNLEKEKIKEKESFPPKHKCPYMTLVVEKH